MFNLMARSHETQLKAQRASSDLNPSKTLSALVADRSGDVAILFGLMAIVFMALTGAAVDLGRWLHARNDTTRALDAAVLAGGRVLQLTGDHAAAIEAANQYYTENSKHRLPLDTDTIAFVVVDDGLGFTAVGDAYISTPFMAFAGVERLPVMNTTGSEYSKAKLAVGGNAKLNIEIGMMLDVSGSMSGSKLSDMKTAAKDLVDIIVWNDQSEYTSKVALAPFSADIRLSNDLLLAARDPSMTGPYNGPNYNCKTKKGKTTCSQDTFYRRDCVVERKGDEKYTGVGPAAGSYVMPLFTKSGNCSTPSASAVVPLSNNKATLKSKIDGLALGGSTAGHLGTAWAWYMISPDWAGVLPEASQPKPYGTENVKKIAILMTDGEYNREYSVYGITSGTSNAPTPSGDANGNSNVQAKALCDGMKDKDIEVYTVGFDLGGSSSAINTLNYCATSPGHAYLAEDGDELKQAFRDIALKISTLYLAR